MDDQQALPNQHRNRSWRQWFSMGLFSLAVATLFVFALQFLQNRASHAEPKPDQPALSVQTTILRLEASYQVIQSHIGRLEAARETELAFEQSGLLQQVLVEEGESVRKGDILARLDTSLLATERQQLLAELASADADIELASLTAERRRQLKDRGFESGQSFDEARLGQSRAQAVRATIAARLDSLDVRLAKSELIAPYSGRIAARLQDEGAVLAAGTSVLHLQEAARPRARIGVPPELTTALEIGAELPITVNGRIWSGRLIAIAPDLDMTTRTVGLLIELVDAENLASGSIARLEIAREIESAGAWVPLRALEEAERGLWAVPVIERDQEKARSARALVEILHTDADRAFVRGSIQDGMEIVEEGPHRLTPGQVVQAVTQEAG